MVYGLLVTLFVIVCVLMVIVILLQASKGGGLVGSIGGVGGSGGILGARGAANLLQKMTIGLGIAYGVLCFLISLVGKTAVGIPESRTQEQIRQEQQVLPPVSDPGELQPAAPQEQPQPSQDDSAQ
ncbi:MAG: preprotein translocase subunit SecG [Calditrichaeota bacterium]|nr:preprotein translocase subunit SecG [Calditrichota bacterium]MCB0296222.1 preprotein translocase subunit SecG [Calditrichota bacterium]MCB0316881.1 preprotein translocase subunit SecG [Calditrichota bacterium]